MRPRFVGRLGPIDVATAGDAALGFVVMMLAAVDVHLAAKVILLVAMADGPDGMIARRYGGTDVGPYLDSLVGVASFSVTPALLVVVVAREMWGFDRVRVVAGVGVAALSVTATVVKLALYTAYDSGSDGTVEVSTTPAATILSADVLVGFIEPMLLVGLSAVMAVLIFSDATYPDLHAQDTLVMGVVQGPTVVCSGALGEGFSLGLLFLVLGYLFLRPRFCWT